jgi:hypothetical protein
MEDPARVHHDQLSESLGEGGDKDTTWDFVRDMVVLDLADFASAERKGATRFFTTSTCDAHSLAERRSKMSSTISQLQA